MKINEIIQGDALEVLKTLSDESIDCAITSPPYWALRDYGVKGQLGLEPTFQEYITKLCDIFDEVKRVLKKEGTCWVNLGDTYAGTMPKKPEDQGNNSKMKGLKYAYATKGTKNAGVQDKSLCQIPSRFAIEMTNRGWILRNEIIWHKPNCMPSSADDRFTVDFEKVFFFTKNGKYKFEQILEPVSEVSLKRAEYGWHGQGDNGKGNYAGLEHTEKMGSRFVNPQGRNKRAVWSINTKGTPEAHFATYPEKLVEPMIMSGCPKGGAVLDIFMGAGTTGLVALNLNRKYLGIELNPEYIKIAQDRIKPYENKLF